MENKQTVWRLLFQPLGAICDYQDKELEFLLKLDQELDLELELKLIWGPGEISTIKSKI